MLLIGLKGPVLPSFSMFVLIVIFLEIVEIASGRGAPNSTEGLIGLILRVDPERALAG